MPLTTDEKVSKVQAIKSTEKIFMIEVIIEKVFLDVIENSNFTFRNAETCLQYSFLDYGPFKICEQDFKGNVESTGCAGCGILKSGLSTLFPLYPDQINALKRNGFMIHIEIIKLFKPVPKIVALTQIPMKFIFADVLDTMLKKYKDSAEKSMKNRYNLSDEDGNPVGYVDLFLRISCMGKVMITKFQIDLNRTCIEFESTSGTPYKYTKRKCVDEFVCAPCGKPRKFFPPYEIMPTTSPEYPPFKVTDDMKKKLAERRLKEQGIQPPPEKQLKTKPRNLNQRTQSKQDKPIEEETTATSPEETAKSPTEEEERIENEKPLEEELEAEQEEVEVPSD